MSSPARERQDAASYLQVYLGPLAQQMARAEVTDLYVNRPGELWVETLGGGIERHEAPELTDALLWRLARQIAGIAHQGISREHPLLAADLPDGSRVQIAAPPATRGSLALAVRRHVAADMTLSELGAFGTFAAVSPDGVNAGDQALAALHAAGEWEAFLRAAVHARRTVLVSGGTSTGKTTFLNALLREVDRKERLVLIEDTPEIRLVHDNAVGLIAVRGRMGEASVSPDDLLAASLRMRPDRVILGELRGAEAFTFLRAVNTGHPGSMTTVHADSPQRAIEQLALMVLQAGTSLRWDDVLGYVRRVVDVIVQIERRGGHRMVSHVAWQPREASL